MNVAPIDAEISRWAHQRGLTVATGYKDEEVRSVQLVDERGRRYQIWVEDLGNGQYRAVAWDYSKRRSEHDSYPAGFLDALEAAYQQVRVWMQQP